MQDNKINESHLLEAIKSKLDLFNLHGESFTTAYSKFMEVFPVDGVDDVFIPTMSKETPNEFQPITVDEICDADGDKHNKPVFKHSGIDKVSHLVIGKTVVTVGKIKPKVLSYLQEKLGNAIRNGKILQTYHNLLNGQTEFVHNFVRQGLLSYDDLIVIRKTIFAILNEHVNKCFEVDVATYQMYEQKLTEQNDGDFWSKPRYDIESVCVNMTKQYDYHPVHDHRCDFAAGLYLEVDQEHINKKSRGGTFNLYVPANATFREDQTFASLTFIPRDGDFLMWRGDINHNMDPSFADTERVMLTWNTNLNL